MPPGRPAASARAALGGVDVQAILAKSFELAGLVAKPREVPDEPPPEGSPAEAEPPTIDGEATPRELSAGIRRAAHVATTNAGDRGSGRRW